MDTVTLTYCWKKSDAICLLQPRPSFPKPHAWKVKASLLPGRYGCQYQWQDFQGGSNKTKLFKKPFFFPPTSGFLLKLSFGKKNKTKHMYSREMHVHLLKTVTALFCLTSCFPGKCLPSKELQALEHTGLCLSSSLCFILAWLLAELLHLDHSWQHHFLLAP